MHQVTPGLTSHVRQQSPETEALPPLQAQVGLGPTRHLHDPLREVLALPSLLLGAAGGQAGSESWAALLWAAGHERGVSGQRLHQQHDLQPRGYHAGGRLGLALHPQGLMRVLDHLLPAGHPPAAACCGVPGLPRWAHLDSG